ncbi:substrate-binding domain-containing protein [Planctobacterium marinum]|uniref:Sugar ABC transporter substrate-binding protein n=1 Tax=Planctobacterium marinum TaxID=1631968 RepID=A0AA48KT57_9ALTE|nr:sugar ABC transporter substrate-binding protein [Planctobacterium marinum]
MFTGISLKLALFALTMGILTWSSATWAKFKIAVIGKTKNDSFYIQSFEGCKQFAAQKTDLSCLYDGPQDYQDIRSQVLIINELLTQNVNGLLVSTTDSKHLVDGVLKSMLPGIPVITFDSDLLPEHEEYRLTYVGTDNFAFGVALGEYAKVFKTEAEQQICIQSGFDSTPNLNARIAGVRHALSGQSTQRLMGHNGWSEYPRCPLYSLGKRDVALYQLTKILEREKAPIFLAVAGFAQFNPDYISTMKKHQEAIDKQHKVIISADTEPMQLKALGEGLSTANIGQNPHEMGRLGAELMYEYLKHGNAPEQSHYYLGFHYCRSDNYQECTQTGN